MVPRAHAVGERGQKVVRARPSSQISGFEDGQLNPLDMIDALDQAVAWMMRPGSGQVLLPALSTVARNPYWKNGPAQLLIGVC